MAFDPSLKKKKKKKKAFDLDAALAEDGSAGMFRFHKKNHNFFLKWSIGLPSNYLVMISYFPFFQLRQLPPAKRLPLRSPSRSSKPPRKTSRPLTRPTLTGPQKRQEERLRHSTWTVSYYEH